MTAHSHCLTPVQRVSGQIRSKFHGLHVAVPRGKPPKFFDGNAKAFSGLHFHLENETFSFYQPLKMEGDPLWVDVSALMQSGTAG